MAKVYTRTSYSAAPTLSLALSAGGNLDPNTTYYYRAMTCDRNTAAMLRCSALSPVQSITTDTTNLTIDITITHSTGNPEYTFIWVIKDTDPGTDNWAITDGVHQLGPASTLVRCTGYPNKITSFSDDGTRNSFMTIGSSNYGMYIPHENARDYIQISGGTSGDPVTIEDIYQYAVSQSWPLNSTIDRVDYGFPGCGDDTDIASSTGYGNARPTYIINMKTFQYDDYVLFQDCNIINFSKQITGNSNSVVIMGEYDSTLDLCKNGVDITTFVHSSQAGQYTLRNCKIYDTKIRARRMAKSISKPYSSRFNAYNNINFDVEIIDSSVGSEFDRGMSTTLTDGDHIIKRVWNYENRWEDNGSSLVGDFSFWRFIIDNSGPWFYTTTATPTTITLKNSKLKIVSAGNRLLYIFVQTTTNDGCTHLELINPEVEESEWGRIYYYQPSTTQTANAAWVKESYEFDLNIVDENGDAVQSASVTML
jgi:hypothetical protein